MGWISELSNQAAGYDDKHYDLLEMRLHNAFNNLYNSGKFNRAYFEIENKEEVINLIRLACTSGCSDDIVQAYIHYMQPIESLKMIMDHLGHLNEQGYPHE